MNILIALYMWVMVGVVACAAEGTKGDAALYDAYRRTARLMLLIVIIFTGVLVGRMIAQWLK